ncbi:MAG: hypothetical protein WB799_19550 [Candidatus Sulfotelmatobacter sp.]
MKLHSPLIRSVGSGVPDYVRRAISSLKKRAFEERLRSYLSEQNVTVEMDRTTINTLFKITHHFLKERAAASEITKAGLAENWNAQRRMVTAVEKLLSEVKPVVEAKVRIEGTPHNSMLARSILLKTNHLLRELEDVALFQRVRASMLPKLMRSTKSEKFYVWELDAYLQHRMPWLQPGQRDLVIAGTMIASGLKSDVGEDHAANSPMARSRANRVMEGEENSVSWLDQAPRRRTATNRRHTVSKGRETAPFRPSSAR